MSKFFTEQQVKEMIWSAEVDRIEHDDRRWTRTIESICEDEDGKFYKFIWEEGLTECQDNEYSEGNYPEVEKHQYEKTIVITEWKEIKQNAESNF